MNEYQVPPEGNNGRKILSLFLYSKPPLPKPYHISWISTGIY
jgi:hypothetical protein